MDARQDRARGDQEGARGSVSSGRIMDLLAEGVQRFRHEGKRGIQWVWDHGVSEGERLAFDVFLVRTGDQLAQQPGSPEDRFTARVLAMALDRPAVGEWGGMDLSIPGEEED